MFWLIKLFHDDIYSFTMNDKSLFTGRSWLDKCQSRGRWLGYYMAIIHFSKRTLECIFLHNFSKSTKSLNRVIWELAYYWLFFGIGVSYYLLHPNYKKPFWERDSFVYFGYVLLIGFLFCQLMNWLCHVHLKDIRVGREDRKSYYGIPSLHGFSSVTAANYFWEFSAWVIFAITT